MPFTPKFTAALADFDAALHGNRVAHAYLVVADVRGEGLEFAEQVLARLFCQDRARPCGQCAACRQVHEHTHPDTVWIEPEKKSRIIGVEKMRDVQKLIYQTAYLGGWKGCVLVGADRLGDDAANVFLKTLEEPPPRCMILLLSDSPQAVLPTVRSRCQCIMLAAESVALLEPWQSRLLGILAAPFDGSVLARRSRVVQMDRLLGDMRKAIEKEEGQQADQDVEDIDGDTLAARVEARYRETRTILLRVMQHWYRDLLVRVCGCDPSALHHQDHVQSLTATAAGLTYRDALINIRVVEEMQRQLGRNLPGETVFACGLSRLTT